MANQQESPTKSPERKKPRPLAKPRKTYIFQPKNTLAFNPQVHSGLRQWRSPQGETFVPPSEHIKTFATSNHEAPQNSRPHPLVSDSHPHTANIDSLASGTASHTRGDGYTSAPSGPSPQPHAPSLTPTPARIFDRSSDQQSSDDSFDGVRWRPAHSPQRFARPILSSPLRNGEIPPHKIPPAGTLVNEITDSMLSKYGMDIPTTNSHTPLFSRTTSDGVVASLDVSPTLARSKSFDPRCLPQGKAPGAESAAEKASRLSTWIDKFEDKPIQQTAADALVNQTPPQQAAPYDDDDTLSSDDDSFLANLNSKSLPLLSQAVPALQTAPTLETTPNPPQTLLSGATKKPSMSPKHCAPFPQKPRVRVCSPHEENDSFDDDSDPFSDDIDIAAIDSVFTQPSTAQSSFATPHSDGVSPALDLKNSEIKSVSPKQDRSYEEKSFGAKISYSRPDFSRYQVKSVFSTSYQVQGFKRKQLILTVADQNDIVSKLMVRGETADLDIKASDVVHVIHTTPENPRLISDSHNLLIWHPDTLVSSTVVADQLECPRKTVLNKRLSFPGSHSIPLLAGTIVHELFQACFITGKCTSEYMESLLELEIQRRLLDIYTLGDVVDELKDKIRSHLPYIQKWFATFFRRAPAEIPTNKRNQKVRFSVAEALDIEERVWSPMFGIKGIADVTLKANLASENSTGQFLVPMEIKTGQPYIHHQAQAALYSLLYKDRYNVDIASFLLVYTSNEGSTTKHDISIPDLKSLVNLRNRISIYLQPGNQVLPGLMRQQKCDRCFVQSSCMTYNYLTENGTAEDSGLKDGVFEDLTAHLEGNEEYKDFLAYWDHLLSKEEEFVSRFDKELWVLTAKEREESSGKSLGSLIISNCETNNNTDEYIYTFKRNGPQGRPFNACQISKYDRIIVSDESGHFALAQGFVRHIEAESIIVASRRQIISTESKTDRFHRAGVLRASQRTSQENVDVVLFRVDKDEFSYGMGVARYNILNLFMSDGDHVRRRLVVDQRRPKFSSSPHFKVDAPNSHFNECQMSAFEQVSKTDDYSLILGMPGTGKTTVIAYLIKMLVAAKKTVLLTSYTNSAVDNILLKVKEYDVDFLRVGSASRVHPSIREYTPGSESNNIECYSDFQKVYSKPYVVAATCLSIQDVSFNIRHHFDYCIIDEASQVSMPLSLGPLALCDKFVMVGDHYQLPPLVSHPDSKIKAGLSQSLFQMLATAHPESVVELKHQYRMCKEIMLISNKLVYNNRLVCGNKQVANQVLEIPNKNKLSLNFDAKNPKNEPWLESVLEERNRVVFFDHDLIPGYERSIGDNTTNPTEVELVRQTVEALCMCGVDPSKIGLMTLYRSQLKLLTETFRHIPELEILTADRFQGRDKDCIVISMVRSNRDRRAGELLKDWRRINVAVTRARAKLIVFGSVSTLSNAESVSDFVALAKRERWVRELSETALDSYHFNKPASSTPKKNKAITNKLSARAIGRHPLVRNILADMNA